MTENDLVSTLQFMLDQASIEPDEDDFVNAIDGSGEFLDCSTSTFREGGVLTMDNGLVLRLKDGNEFYITVKKK